MFLAFESMFWGYRFMFWIHVLGVIIKFKVCVVIISLNPSILYYTPNYNYITHLQGGFKWATPYLINKEKRGVG